MEGTTTENVPKWLTKSYLENILQSKYSTNLQVKSYTVEPAVAAGNNYLSSILRVKIMCCENELHSEHNWIIKAVHPDEKTATDLHEFYDTEIRVYSDIIPRIHGLLRSIGDTEVIAPTAIYVDDARKTMIMPDMKHLRYSMENRKIGMDWEHMRVVVRKHAKLHACSMVLAEQGEEFKEFRKSLQFNKDCEFNPFYIHVFHELGEFVKTWPGYEKYGEKLMKISGRIVDEGIHLFAGTDGEIKTFIHGDSWITNIMFKHDANGHPEDAALIDFQLSYYGSPTLDLIYFFWTSANDEVRYNPMKIHEMLHLYHGLFVSTLKDLGSKIKPPTLFELHQDYYRRTFYGLSCSVVLSLMISDKEEGADLQNIIGDSEASSAYRKLMFTNPRFLKTMKHFLPLWDAQGLLDPLR